MALNKPVSIQALNCAVPSLEESFGLQVQDGQSPSPFTAFSSTIPLRNKTKRIASPYVPHINDGIDLDMDPLLLERERLQNAILDAGNRVLINSPPASGKSVLLQLLERRLKDAGKSVVRISALSCPKKGSNEDENSHGQAVFAWLNETINARGLYSNWELAMEGYDFILLDDVHNLYSAQTFWDSLVKYPGGAHIFFFAATSIESLDHASPAVPTRKISWKDFQLLGEEEDELCKKILDHPMHSCHHEWFPRIMSALRKDAAGHIGVIRCLAQLIIAHFPNVGNHKPDVAEVLRFYYGAMLDAWTARRFFRIPNWDATTMGLTRKIFTKMVLAEEEVDVPPLRDVDSPPDPPDIFILRKMMRAVIIVEALGTGGRPVLQFATPMHRRFYFRLAFPSVITPAEFEKVKDNLDDWLILVLRTFEVSHLQNENSSGTDRHPKEGMIQHQFWRGASMCLPANYRLAAEVSKVVENDASTEKNEELDFWINTDLNWAVEILRAGNRKGKHLKHFQEHGGYQLLKPKAWRVVDFRRPKSKFVPKDGYVAVVFDEDYTGATFTSGMSTARHISFIGTYATSQQHRCLLQ